MRLIGKPLVVILGATAVGKTQLSIPIAQQFDGVILSADSRQIYRYMNIGTAKATHEQLQQAPHELIDIVNPDDNLTLAEYQDLAFQQIDKCHQIGKLPMLVGGTGQYITAIVEGWSIPRVPPNLELRAELQSFADEQGIEALHNRLVALDPEYAEKTHPNNVRRVIRALEVCMMTDDTMTNQQRKNPPPYDMYTLGLTMSRENLYERADLRVDYMIEVGFVEEVENLLKMGYSRELPSMSGLGYREIASYLANEQSLEESIRQTKSSTHDFIRRQDVWFRGHDHGIIWHNSETVELKEILTTLAIWLEEIESRV